jgi:flagellar motor protein MotB
MRVSHVLAAAVLTAASFASVGCSDSKTAAANKQLWQQNHELQAKLDEANSKLASAPDQNEYNRLQAELAARESRISELEKSLKTVEPGQDPAIAGVETSYDAKTRTLTVNLPGDILFPAGMNTLKKSAYPTLDKIVAALKNDYKGKKVEVKGHTDSDPIAKTKKIYKDNLELSLERAATVTRYLESKGVDPKSIQTTGLGENAPRDEKNKALNRRVEISVLMD